MQTLKALYEAEAKLLKVAKRLIQERPKVVRTMLREVQAEIARIEAENTAGGAPCSTRPLVSYCSA